MDEVGSKSFGQPVSKVLSQVEGLESRRLFCSLHDGGADDVAELAPTSHAITDALTKHDKPGPVVDHKGSWYKPARKVTIHAGRSLTTGKTVPVIQNSVTAKSAVVGRAADSVSFSTNAAGLPLLTSRADGKGLKIFLDFDGYNSDIPFDLDGNTSNFNTQEQTVIYNAWRDIVSYYSMLDVNVTTVQPPTGGTNPNFVWQRITDSVSGGAAYVGAINNNSSMGWTDDSNAVSRTSGIAHEIGHQLSLSHQADWNDDATKLNEYSSGYTAHGPIIGVDFAQQVHKWWFGRNSDGADHLQDDLKAMSTYLKSNYSASVDGYMPDDYTATSIAGATALTLSGNNYLVTGSIERNTDADYFSFSSTGSPFDLHVEPTYFSPLAPKLELYNASGLLIASKDDTSLRNAADNTGMEFTLTLPAGTYYAKVSGHGDYSDQGEYAFYATPLPAGWAASDVAPGATGRGGSANYNGGTFTVVGSGSDIGGTADELHFVYQLLSGNSSITARVNSFVADDAFAKAGLMIRETLAAGSRNASLYYTPSRYEYANRTSFNGGTTYATPAIAANSWLRLSRSGNVITYSSSTDGVTFNTLGSVTISGLASPVFVGMVVTSKSRRFQATATFTDVTVTGTPPATPTYSSVAAPTALTATPVSTQSTNVQLAWVANVAATGYVVERSNDGVTWSTLTTLAAGTTSYTNTLTFGSMRYWYRVSSTDAAGTGAPSDAVSVVNKPAAPTNAQAVRMDGTRLSLTWRDISGETGYRVERSTDGGSTYTTLTTLAANIRGYNVTGLTSGTAYTFRITPTSTVGDGVPLILNTATPLPAVANLRFTSKASTQLAIAWDDLSSEAGYRVERSTDGTTWTTLTTTAANVTSYVDNTVTAVNEYYYRVAGVLSGVPGVTATILAATPTAVALPTGWTSGDLGGVGGSGATGQSNGTWTVIGSGDDIWNSADELQFASRSLAGNGEIVARVNSQESTDGWAKAGVMIRETLTAGSRQAMMVLSPDNGSQFGYRTATNGASGWTGADAVKVKAPYWVKLVRNADVITGYISADGTTWTSRGSITLGGLAANVFVGLANCSGNDGLLNTTKFDNVTVTQATPQPKVSLVLLENGATQRSMIHNLSVRFDQQVTLATDAISLTRNGVAVPFTLSPGSGSSLIFALNFGTGGLGDGTYTLTVNAAGVTGAGGTMASNYTYSFYRLYGDVDADRAVTFNDFLVLQNAFGSTSGSASYNAGLDVEDNGVIDFNDFLALQNNFGKTI